MNAQIINRTDTLPTDGWYQIEASGEHINHASRVVQVIDTKAVASMVTRFTKEAIGNENFAGLPIDKDHLGNSLDNPTEALGWVMALRNRDGVLEAKIDWTDLGEPLVKCAPGKAPAYKFFSTEYEPGDCEKIGMRAVGSKTYDVIRPLRLDGLSLTNDPNNKGQRPISNRSGDPVVSDDNPEREKAQRISNRAAELKKERPTRSFDSCWQQATSEATTAGAEGEPGEAQRIYNRSMELKGAAPARSFDACYQQATSEAAVAGVDSEEAAAKRIYNRSMELKGAAPARSFDSCWQQASNEAASPDA